MISNRIAAHLKDASWIRKLFEEGQKMRADGGGPVYDFSIGNPELEPPRLLRERLARIGSEDTPGNHGCMPNVGYSATR